MSRKYVVHYCHNKECNNCWIDKDVTNVKTVPPKWKYCEECSENLGIDFNKQKPSDVTSEEQKERTTKMKKAKKSS